MKILLKYYRILLNYIIEYYKIAKIAKIQNNIQWKKSIYKSTEMRY